MPLYGFPSANGMSAPMLQSDTQMERVKRKMWDQSDCTMDIAEIPDGQDCPAKRQCKEIFPDPAGDNGIVVQHGQLHNFTFPHAPPGPVWQTQAPQQTDSELHGCMKDIIGGSSLHPYPPRPVTPPAQIAQPPVMTSSPMMMDGETYSRVSESDLDLCLGNMDSEGAPNPSQFDLRQEFCSAPCTGGVRSPVSNNIKCPCKPWGARESAHYHSDYY